MKSSHSTWSQKTRVTNTKWTHQSVQSRHQVCTISLKQIKRQYDPEADSGIDQLDERTKSPSKVAETSQVIWNIWLSFNNYEMRLFSLVRNATTAGWTPSARAGGNQPHMMQGTDCYRENWSISIKFLKCVLLWNQSIRLSFTNTPVSKSTDHQPSETDSAEFITAKFKEIVITKHHISF